MRIIAVDDEQLALDNITRLVQKLLPDAEIRGFLRSAAALEALQSFPADIAFLDIEMGRMNGLILAKKCKDLCPDMNIIFVTGFDQYAMDAMRLHASGYLMKPVRPADLRTELEHLRHPIPLKPRCRVRIQTFGNFEVFVDNKPLALPLAKCRECLAFLVDRKGARVTSAELGAVLWEDRPYDKTVQNNTHRVTSDLMKALHRLDIADIIIKTNREIAIDPNKIDCDYFRFLAGDVSQINTFRGEYMTNYSWAEFTLAEITDAKSTP